MGSPIDIFFFIPSKPAATIQEKARYGLQEESGARNSILFILANFSPLKCPGIRIMADLLSVLQATYPGASYPGTNLL
jgi:hypothetical protein